MKKGILSLILISLFVLSSCSSAATVDVPAATATESATPTAEPAPTIPPEITGEVVYVPFPVQITVDGDRGDWSDIPAILVDRGPTPSSDPNEDGSFTFKVAADADTFFITMEARDKNIIAGQHGSEFWNEDSLEFYLNTTADLDARKYAPGMFQLNINATDIGNTDPQALTITGVQHADVSVTGYVFKTDPGWGYEASIPLTGLITPAHGLEVGFQAQMNGASTADRDSKLIWSNADTADQSWQIPALFGRAIFYELGRTDVPQPSVRAELPTATPTAGPVVIPALISVNQVGYFPDGEKIASLVLDSTDPVDWSLRHTGGSELLSGKTIVKGKDANSGDFLHVIDFSAYTTSGVGYTLVAASLKSPPFNISSDIYSNLKHDALSYFYLNRSGIEISAEYAGENWARLAGHLSDNAVTCFKGKDSSGVDWSGCDYTQDVSGGWYDAGDFGKYVVNGGIAAWTLMDLYEQFPTAFPDNTQKLPEAGNGVPDVLDEARWEMEFLLSMQVPEGQALAGMVHHKIHDETWAAMPMVPPTEVDNDNSNSQAGVERYLFPPSTAATLNLAATGAQCARIWKDIDAGFSQQCLAAAETAWKAAQDNPTVYARRFSAGGGDYGDESVSDEFYWAASELFITTAKAEYGTYVINSREFGRLVAFDWGYTAPLGTISLLMTPNTLAGDKLNQLRNNLKAYADTMITVQDKDGYAALIAGDYPWGSNGTMLNNMMLMGDAYRLTGDAKYLNSVRMGMDYILGRNSLNRSFVSGYGTYPMQHPHHRFWANDPANGYPKPPPGAVSGGPNFNPTDDAAKAADLMSRPPAKRYLDELLSYSTNEVAINWNAPLVWVAAFLDQTSK